MPDPLEISDGILLVDKPANMTSFGVVARIRRVLSRRAGKRIKVGHTGTLDPFATGLMILVIGKECRNAGHYSKLDKIYEATFRLGQVSTTGDPEGEVTDISDRRPKLQEIEDAMGSFVGTIEQTPPLYSAIKINGQRAYKLARRGEEVAMPSRPVTIRSLELLDYTYPKLKIRAHVGSGTYIRSLAVDIGKALETGAYCYALKRTSVSNWGVKDAHPLSDFGIETA